MPPTREVLSTEFLAPKLKPISALHPLLANGDTFVVLDIETTGFSLEQHSEILEIAAVKLCVSEGKITAAISTAICPSELFSISAKTTELTGISWDTVKDSPYLETVMPAVADFIGNLPVVAHNAQFDWSRFLLPAFRRVGLHMPNDVVCTMRLAKALCPNRKRDEYNLKSLCAMFGREIEGQHRARVDCRWTASLFLRLLKEYRTRAAAASCLEGGDPYIPPNPVPTADFKDLKITKVSFWQGRSKKHGPKLFVNTNYGKLFYSPRRNLWSVQELWIEQNAPVSLWGKAVENRLADEKGVFDWRTFA